MILPRLSIVSVPYEITLLSNLHSVNLESGFVSVPYEITLLSNSIPYNHIIVMVSVPYEITLLSNYILSLYKSNRFSTL